jgi:hypothetical protein
MTATVALPEARNLLTSKFDPTVLDTMSNSELLDLIDLGIHGQANVSNLIAHSVVAMIERGAYDLVKARFGGSNGEEEPSFLVTKEARKALAPRVIKKGWSQQQVADLFGVSQFTISNDAKHVIETNNADAPDELPATRVDSKGRVQPTRKPRAKKEEEEEPVDAELVENFKCANCRKQKPFGTRVEVSEDTWYCEPCADAYDQTKPGDEVPVPKPVVNTARRSLTRLQAKLKKLVGETSVPWSGAASEAILKLAIEIQDLTEDLA